MSESTTDPASLITDSITVTTQNGESFVFRIPNPREYARIGARSHELRRQDSPTTGGAEYGLDGLSSDLYRGFALLEILLTKADTKSNWVYSQDANGKPVIDISKFPPQSILTIPEVARSFEESLAKFLTSGA